MESLSFGIRLPHCGPLASVGRVDEMALLAEKLGYASVWTNDYVVWTRELHDLHITCGAVESLSDDDEPYFLDSLTTLAHLSGKTRRVQLGIAVLIAPYRHPVLIARHLASLNAFAPGRIIAGFGIGAGRQTKNPNFDVLGIPIDERMAITGEYLRVVRMVLRNGGGSYKGAYVSFEDAVVAPGAPDGEVPMWMGGSSTGALRLVAESCDGWIPTWFEPEDFERTLPRLGQLLSDRGRSLSDITLAREVYLCIDKDAGRAQAIAKATLENNARWFTVRGLKEYEERLALVKSSSLVGDPAQIIESIARYARVGVTHLEFKVIARTWEQLIGMMELFADEVMSHFRDGTEGRAMSGLREMR